MTGDTHRAGGMLVTVVGYALLKRSNLLLQDVNPCLQWLIIYPFCMWGSIASDLDHHKEAIPMHDYPSQIINKVLHITSPLEKSMDETLSTKVKNASPVYKLARTCNAHHRSWQTHSDLTLIVMLLLLRYVLSGRVVRFGAVDTAIASLVLIGVSLGVVAHLVLDALTPDGIHLLIFKLINRLLGRSKSRIRLPEKFHLVPHRTYFATDGIWERKVQKFLKFGTWFSLLYFFVMLVYPYVQAYFPYSIEFG